MHRRQSRTACVLLALALAGFGNTMAIDGFVDSGGIQVPTEDGFTQLRYIFAGPFAGGWTSDDLNFYDPIIAGF